MNRNTYLFIVFVSAIFFAPAKAGMKTSEVEQWVGGDKVLFVQGEQHDRVYAYGVNIYMNCGETGRINTLMMGGGQLSQYYGSIGFLALYEDAVANEYWGEVGILCAYDSSIFNLRVDDPASVVWHSTGGAYDCGYLEYTIENIARKIELGENSAAHINIVPEPATIFLFGLGGLLIRRKG